VEIEHQLCGAYETYLILHIQDDYALDRGTYPVHEIIGKLH